MLEPRIAVTVTGKPGEGKTTVAHIIQQALEAHGIACSLSDDDDHWVASLQERRIYALNTHGLHVNIKTTQRRR